MIYTEKLIDIIDHCEELYNEAVLEAREQKPIEKRAMAFREFLQQLVDDAPWFPRTVVDIVFETVNWEAVIRFFEGKETVQV